MAGRMPALRKSLVFVVLLAALLPEPGSILVNGNPVETLRDFFKQLVRSFSNDASDGSEGVAKRRHSRTKSVCEDLDYRKVALKLAKEQPFSGLFRNVKGQNKFEGSGLVEYQGKYLVVFDSLEGIGYLDDRFEFMSPNNWIIGEPGGESEYEGVTVMTDTGRIIVLEEAREHGDHYHPVAIELVLSTDLRSYSIYRECVVNFDLSHGNKGFEGVHYYWDGEQGYLLGLCEGNHCRGGDEGKDPGNGKIVVSTLSQSSTNSSECSWVPTKVVDIPKAANFLDYSEIAVRGNTIAISSQEDAAIFIDQFDWSTFEFADNGKVYYLPRDSHCDMVYCNVEGIEFIDDHRIILTSDRSKKYQPYQCVAKDQSLHVFIIP